MGILTRAGISVLFVLLAFIIACSGGGGGGSKGANGNTGDKSGTESLLSDFQYLSRDIGITGFTVSPRNPDLLYCVDEEFKLFISENAGLDWTEIPNTPLSEGFRKILISNVDDGILFVVSDEAILRSLDGGYNWESVATLYEGDIWSSRHWRNISVDGENIIATRYDVSYDNTGMYKLLKSTDNGNNWVIIGPPGVSFPFGIIVDNGYIYTHGYDIDWNGNTQTYTSYLYFSNNGGQTFDRVNPCRNVSPLPGYEICHAQYMSFFIDQYSRRAYAASNNGLYISEDDGTSWARITSLPDNTVEDVVVVNDAVFIISSRNLKASFDNMTSWEMLEIGNEGNPVEPKNLGFSGDFVYFNSHDGIYRAEIY